MRSSLAAVILQMLFLRLGDISKFPFLDPPEPKMINDGFTLLAELGAVDSKRQLTEIGQQLAKLPIDPRIGRMILAAKQDGCLREVLIIGSALSIQDPRERPLDMQEAADIAQQQFSDERSDFLSFLKLWHFFQEKAQNLSKNKLRKWCQEHFLSYRRLREWEDIHQQIYSLIKEQEWQINELEASYAQIHQALLAGLLGNIACKTESEHYLGTRNTKLFLFPGSSLYKKSPKWLISAELVETSRLFARCAAKIVPEWIEQVAGHLCQHHYFEPHWEKRMAEVAGYERVTLYGLTIVPKRKINFGPLDPKVSREIFIRHALVQGDYATSAQFFQHNQQLISEIEDLEHKARRQDILVDEEQLYEFYDARIPAGIYNGKDFEKWRKQAERDNQKCLFLTKEDLMLHGGDSITKQAFPDFLVINDVKL
ncbi:MAG: ATP-dependent RNA helicase HrpA, partial [Beggiatoa sp. IS2]